MPKTNNIANLISVSYDNGPLYVGGVFANDKVVDGGVTDTKVKGLGSRCCL
jgi:hypothetical protein